jgi:hypothetical protein
LVGQNMKYPDIESFGPDPSYFEEMYPNVWLMDDHRWSYYIWEKCFHKYGVTAPYTLLHIDKHWDAVNDFLKDGDQEQLCYITDINKIRDIVSDNLIRKDSFIAPAIIRGIINEVHFLCFQDYTTQGLSLELLNKFSSSQVIYTDQRSFVKDAPSGSLFDIDIDIFNRSDYWATGELWTDNEILEFLDDCSELIKSSPLVTIAMSFGYSGTEEDTKHLTRLVVHRVMEIFRHETL